MAELVLGMAVSHSPALNLNVDEYGEYGEKDKTDERLADKEGRVATYDQLLAQADPAIVPQLTREVLGERIADCEKNMEHLARTLGEARLDALIIVGDDQGEQYIMDNMPAMLIYWGETIPNTVTDQPAGTPPFLLKARAQYHEPSGVRDYPVQSHLALHLIESLTANEFDVSNAKSLRFERGEGHAFGFVHRRLMGEQIIPIVPFALNTYFPPNQPLPKRCYGLGQALRRAVEAWDSDARVGILGSGGLSHFLVDEELDRGVLAALRDKDREKLISLPLNKLNFGNSEIRNWITVAAAAEDMENHWQAYQPCYRTPGGTGCGMGFAVWY
ncbi:MAG: extradiol ring-cleavage dioxygenase [Alphaproteobacteria bacterium]|nr:extradiol ring-cleavage dioxygenase [Alphaproteobacteria bacterium]